MNRVKNTRSGRYDGKTQDHTLDKRYEQQKLIALLATPMKDVELTMDGKDPKVHPYPKPKSVFDQ